MCRNSDTVYFSLVCSLDAWMYWIYFFQLINWKSISSLWLWRSCSISSLSTNRQRHVSRASDICRIIWMLSRVKRKRGRNCQRDGMVESGNVWPSNCMFLLSADDKNILSLLLYWHHLGTLNSIVKSRMNSDFDQRMKDSLWLPPPPAVRKIVRTVGGFRHSPLVPSSSTIPPPLSPWPSVRGSSRGLVIPPPPLPGIKFHLTLSLSRGAERSSKRWE